MVSVKTLKNELGELLQHLGMKAAISERVGYKNYTNSNKATRSQLDDPRS